MFSNWETQKNSDNSTMLENFNKGEFKKSVIPVWFKNKYHPTQTGFFKTEYFDNFGIYGEKPNDKFFDKTQKLNKLYSDNYEICKGTSKATDLIPGYSGKIKFVKIYFRLSS